MGCVLFWITQELTQDALDATGATLILERSLKQVIWVSLIGLYLCDLLAEAGKSQRKR